MSTQFLKQQPKINLATIQAKSENEATNWHQWVLLHQLHFNKFS